MKLRLRPALRSLPSVRPPLIRGWLTQNLPTRCLENALLRPLQNSNSATFYLHRRLGSCFLLYCPIVCGRNTRTFHTPPVSVPAPLVNVRAFVPSATVIRVGAVSAGVVITAG
jgi:hypothetical protein